jgi:hypothetical protein
MNLGRGAALLPPPPPGPPPAAPVLLLPPCRRRSVLDALWVRRAGSYAGRFRVPLLMGSGLSS